MVYLFIFVLAPNFISLFYSYFLDFSKVFQEEISMCMNGCQIRFLTVYESKLFKC